jgi:hypothetical protein
MSDFALCNFLAAVCAFQNDERPEHIIDFSLVGFTARTLPFDPADPHSLTAPSIL